MPMLLCSCVNVQPNPACCSPRGERPQTAPNGVDWVQGFSIHAPRVGSDAPRLRQSSPWSYFNPRSPCGERQRIGASLIANRLFQSTLPSRGATAGSFIYDNGASRFQSTLPSRGATVLNNCLASFPIISIHAPLAGSDRKVFFYAHGMRISIHAPLAGSDDSSLFFRSGRPKFQSTLPSRGATGKPHLPRRKRGISIHAPLAGSDLALTYGDIDRKQFQSTLPSRGATRYQTGCSQPKEISIHAPLAGSDYHWENKSAMLLISIHAPLAGSDRLDHHQLN